MQMKIRIAAAAAAVLTLLSGCSAGQTEENPDDVSQLPSEVLEESSSPASDDSTASETLSAPSVPESSSPPEEDSASSEAGEVSSAPSAPPSEAPVSSAPASSAPVPSAPVSSSPAPSAAPPSSAPAPASSAPASSAAYGAVPFEAAAGTGMWFDITAPDDVYDAVLANINAYRADAGAAPLSTSEDMMTLALDRCHDMIVAMEMSHDGYVTAEIIAQNWNSAQSVVNAWANSAGHYAAMTDPQYTICGIGCVFEEGGCTYWCVTLA